MAPLVSNATTVAFVAMVITLSIDFLGIIFTLVTRLQMSLCLLWLPGLQCLMEAYAGSLSRHLLLGSLLPLSIEL
jgi:hypothetical protein